MLSGCREEEELGNSRLPSQLHKEQMSSSSPGSRRHLAAFHPPPELHLPEDSTRGGSRLTHTHADVRWNVQPGTSGGGKAAKTSILAHPLGKAGDPCVSPEIQRSIQQPFLEHPQCEVPDTATHKGYTKVIRSSHHLEGEPSIRISNCMSK